MNRILKSELRLLALVILFTAAPVIAGPDVQVCFTPEYGSTPSCTQDIVNALDAAWAELKVILDKTANGL
jgi:hypothetical protein